MKLSRSFGGFDPTHAGPYLRYLGERFLSWLAFKLLDKVASKIKANHIFGGLLITAGQVGVGASGTFFYVWCWVIAPPNAGIASHSALLTSLPIWAVMVEFPIMCLLVGFVSVVVQLNGIVRLAPRFTKAAKRIPLVGRFVVRGKRPERAPFRLPSYIQAVK